MKKNLILSAMLAIALIASAQPVVDVDSLARSQRVVLDISHYQGVINFDQVAQSTKWIFLKATEGSNLIDPSFLTNAKEAKRVEIKVGAYHYFTEKSSARLQAVNYLKTIGAVDIALVPVVDVEVCNLLAPDELRDSVQLFADCVEAVYGCKPIIYTNEVFFRENLQTFGESYPLWIAKYSNEAPNVGFDIILWQMSERGIVNGIEGYVDVSVFVGKYRPRDIKLPFSKSDGNKKDSKSKKSKKNDKRNRNKKEKLINH
jgi:lysozyme